MKLCTLLLVLCCHLISLSTEIDSLKTAYHSSRTAEEKLKALSELNKQLISLGSLDSSLHYFKEMSEIAKELKDETSECIAYRYMCESYMYLNNMDSATFVMLKALQIDDNKVAQFVLDANQLGRAYHYFNEDTLALQYYEMGLKKYLSRPRGTMICTLLSNMATSYNAIGDDIQKLQFNLYSAYCSECTNDETLINRSHYVLGWSYLEIGEYKKAEDYFLKCLEDSVNQSLQTYVNRNHHALGITYSRWGYYEKALNHNAIALEHYRKTGNKLYEFDVTNNIATVYLRLEDYNKSLEYAETGLKLATSINHNLAILGAHLTLIETFIGLNEFNLAKSHLESILMNSSFRVVLSKKELATLYLSASKIEEHYGNLISALQYLKLSKELNEEALKSELNTKFFEKENKYQAEKKERVILEEKLKNASLTQEKTKAENDAFNVKLTAASTLTITFAVLYFFHIRNKRKKEIMYENQKELLVEKSMQISEGKRQERQRLQDQLHTDIKNSLSNIKGGLKIIISPSREEYKYVEELDRTMNKIRDLSHSMELANHETELHLSGFIQNLVDESTTPFRPINFASDERTKKLNLSNKALLKLYYIVKEGIANARTHGNPDKIDISLESNKSNVTLLIIDDGIGITSAANEGFGTRSLKRIARELKGTLKYQSKQGIGTTLKVEIPLKHILK